jgi:hypothetical protein
MAALMDLQHASDFVALLPPRRADHITLGLQVAPVMVMRAAAVVVLAHAVGRDDPAETYHVGDRAEHKALLETLKKTVQSPE